MFQTIKFKEIKTFFIFNQILLLESKKLNKKNINVVQLNCEVNKF